MSAEHVVIATMKELLNCKGAQRRNELAQTIDRVTRQNSWTMAQVIGAVKRAMVGWPAVMRAGVCAWLHGAEEASQEFGARSCVGYQMNRALLVMQGRDARAELKRVRTQETAEVTKKRTDGVQKEDAVRAVERRHEFIKEMGTRLGDLERTFGARLVDVEEKPECQPNGKD